MPFIDLLKRGETSAALNVAQFDTNYTLIENAINQLAVTHPIRPEDYTTGTDAGNLIAAFNDGIATGRPVRLDGLYTISAPLTTISMTGAGTLYVMGSGRIHITADLNTTPALTIHATYPASVAVSAITVENHTFPTGDTSTSSTKITASGHGIVAGDIFKIIADNLISNSPDLDARVGQFGHAADVLGTSFWMGGQLYDSYSTNIRVVRVRKEARLIWDGPGFTSVAGNVWDTLFLRVMGFVQPRIRTWVRDGYSTGVDIKSCLQADVDIEILGLKNSVTTQSFGYGVRDTSSAYSRVRVRSIDCRHAYTTNTAAATTNDQAYLYGRTFGAVVSGLALGNSASPFDTHSEGTDTNFENCSSGNNYLGSSTGGQAISLRGANNTATSCIDRNSANGFSFISAGNNLTVDCSFVNCRYYGAGTAFRINASDGVGTVLTPRIIGGVGRSSATTMVQAWDCVDAVIDGLRLEPTGSSGQAILLSGNSNLIVRNLVIDLRNYTGSNNYRAFAFSTSSTGNSIIVESVKVINATGKFQAWLSPGSSSGSLTLANFKSDAAPSSGNVINAGTATINIIDGWAVAGSWTYSTDVAQVDFLNLAYDEIRVIARLVTKQTTGTLNIRTSTNNGSTFSATSGNYVEIAADGQETALTGIPLHNTNATLARSGSATISGSRNDQKKQVYAHNRNALSTVELTGIINAVRVYPSGGGNLTGGSILVLGK
jgi:hypothetical protein